MKFKKVLSVVLASAMVLGMTACGGGDSKESSSDKKDDAKTEASSDDKKDSAGSSDEVTLTMWSWSPITRTCDKMLEAFEKENPGIKIDFTYYNYDPEYLSALSAAAASDSLPDIIGLQPGSLTQQYADYLVDLNQYAKADWGDNWKDSFYKIAADQITLGNKAGDEAAYILPIEAQTISIEYNKKLFEKFNLEVPKTYDDLKNVAKTLTDNGIAPLFQGGASGWQNVNVYLMLCSQIDKEMFDKAQNGEIKWTDEKLVKAMANWKKLFDDGIIQVGALSASAYPDGVNALTSGNAGMIALGSWWTQEFTGEDVAKSVADWDFDYFYLPAVEDGLTASTPVGGIDFGYGITKNCKNPDAAWKALKSFSSGAGIQACADDLNNLPAYKGIAPKAELPENIVKQFNSCAADLDSAMNQRIGAPTIDTALQNALAGVAAGELTPDAGMQAVQDAQDALK